jgi:hypothetical protein
MRQHRFLQFAEQQILSFGLCGSKFFVSLSKREQRAAANSTYTPVTLLRSSHACGETLDG